MAVFRIERYSRLPVGEAWRRLTDWERHGERVPLSTSTVTTEPPMRAGSRFTVRTGIGPAGFDDVMEVVRWEPPKEGRAGRCRVEKRGRVVTGWAEIEVAPADGGSRIAWCEELRVGKLPRPFDALAARASRLLFGRVVDGLLAGRQRRHGPRRHRPHRP